MFDVRLQRISAERNQDHQKLLNKYNWLKKYDINDIVDIGANDGHFAHESSVAFNEARYFCFEPIPSVFQTLQKRFSDRKNFLFYNSALGQDNTTGTINLNEYSPSSSILDMEELHKKAFDFTKNTAKQEIVIRRLDDFIDEIKPGRQTLVKIDVQGYEMNVIEGGIKFLKESKVVIIEASFEKLYKDQPLFHDVYEALRQLGFTYHGNMDQLYNPINSEILQADSIFINQNP